jgi:hypothetical protein
MQTKSWLPLLTLASEAAGIDPKEQKDVSFEVQGFSRLLRQLFQGQWWQMEDCKSDLSGTEAMGHMWVLTPKFI